LATDQIGDYIKELDGEKYVSDPAFATVDRTLVFEPASSIMYPTAMQPFEPGEREDWEYVDTTHVRFNDATYTESREFDGTLYLIRDHVPALSWRLFDDERLYLGYRVRKATAMADSAVIEAWFAPDIPITAGPGLYGGLPGLILMVTNTARGEVYAAESIELGKQKQYTAPRKGNVVSRSAYDKRVAREVASAERAWEITRRRLKNSKRGQLN